MLKEIPSYDLQPLGELTPKALLHLLKRSLFGAGQKDLTAFHGKDINQSLNVLLTPSSFPAAPVQEDSDIKDPLVPRGHQWTKAPYENDLIDNRRALFLRMWWMGNILNRDHSLTEKMTLFWHTHFVTEMDIVKDSRYSYTYLELIRKHALGNMKSLIREGTTNIAMLVYLGGNQNTKSAPNENYARELFELFTLGKDPRVKYTEEDIRAAARILSGYKDDKDTLTVTFDPDLHDTGDKHFSAYFENHTIKGQEGLAGKTEIDELIDMIFRRRDAALFFCRNIYRWFVCDTIDDRTEELIIEPLAQTFIDHDFEVVPVIRQLLSSRHFFDPAFRGAIVKSPVDLLIGSMHEFDMVRIHRLDTNHEPWLQFFFLQQI